MYKISKIQKMLNYLYNNKLKQLWKSNHRVTASTAVSIDETINPKIELIEIIRP